VDLVHGSWTIVRAIVSRLMTHCCQLTSVRKEQRKSSVEGAQDYRGSKVGSKSQVALM
jgi:hypothetical protein